MTAVSLFGTPGATLNLGVGALRDSTVAAIRRAAPDADVTVFDDGWGVREVEVPGGTVTLCGGRDSRRWHRPEAFARMRLAISLGGGRNPGAQRILASSAVFDISGGDSFSDLYGLKRFRTVAWPKRLAIAARRPLVLLPQTYGPFRDPKVRAEATRLLRGATQVWARDPQSKTVADEMLGADTALRGVDMAFGLPVTSLDGPALDRWESWLAASDAPVAGININGMLVNQADATERYGVTSDHRGEMLRVARTILSTSAWRVAVVPHVLGEGSFDSDVAVCRQVATELRSEFGAERVHLADECRTPGQTKSVISRCSWFTGARMHSTIAAVSSGVPTGGVAYSDKIRPVFAELEQPVVDARTASSDEIVDDLVALWRDRDRAAQDLRRTLPPVLEACTRQIGTMLTAAADASPIDP